MNRARPVLESLETREVPVSGFLQGTAYIDSNNNGTIDADDALKSGALIQLFRQAGNGFTEYATTTADANGNYLFQNLPAGTYRIVDATPNYTPVAATYSASSLLYAPTVTLNNAIEVTIIDRVRIDAAARPADAAVLNLTIPASGGGTRSATGRVYQHHLTVSGGGLGSPVSFTSFCLDLTENINPPASFFADPQPLEEVITPNSGRIAYLYNHYGRGPLPAVEAAALQIAIWELEYDTTPDLTLGNFRYLASGNTGNAHAGTIESLAQGYLAESAGQSERAIYLNAAALISGGGMQSMIAPSGRFDFLNVPILSTITGTKVTDLTGDGLSPDDTPLGGTAINLYAGDSAAGTPLRIATTAADGTYSFTGLAPGTYFVQEVVPAGYTQTGGTAGYVVVIGAGSGATVPVGGTATGNDFANFQNIAISGTKTNDVTGNGFSGDDTPLAGVTINLYKNGSADPVASTTTGADGSYSFADLGPGTYVVREVLPEGDIQTGGAAEYTLAATSGANSAGNDFANFRLGSIAGVKFNDLNGNGARDGDEPGLSGWTIELDRDADGTADATTVTGAGGAYSFAGLTAGVYRVREAGQPGWVQTTIDPGDVTVVSGTALAGLDFGNARPAIDVEKYVKEVTTGGGEGLTPGYWKQSHHFDTWVPTGYAPDMRFNAVFGVNDPSDPTLLQALQTGGGGFAALGRHAVAALLNASHPTVEYEFTAAEVIAKVRSAYAAPGTVEGVKNQLATENERGADLTTGTPDPDPNDPGSDADTPDGLVLQVGSQVVFTFYVTNPGPLPLADVVVIDDNATPNDAADDYSPAPVLSAGFNVGDADRDGVLDVGERWVYTAGPVAVTEGPHANVAVVTGTAVGTTQTVTDGDPAHWFGIADRDGRISGAKYRDVSGNGLNVAAGPHAPADVPLAGVTVYLDANNNKALDAGEARATTDAQGRYEFTGLTPGTYTVREVVPSGWVRTGPVAADAHVVTVVSGTDSTGNDFANFETVCTDCTIEDVSYRIVHADGTSEVVSDLRGQTREGDLITVTFTIGAPGAFVVSFVSYTAPEPYFSAGTASQQRIYDLATGTFGGGRTGSLTISVPNSYYQVDFVCGYAIDRLGPAGSNVFYTPQKRLVSADNGGTRAPAADAGSVSGVKYNDKNGNGGRDAGEPGLGEWVVFIDDNDNGKLDAGERATVTRPDGSYTLSNVPAGSHRVREVQEAGWTATATPGAVVVAAGQNAAGADFGNRHAAPGSVSGYKFNDRNADGAWDKNGLDNKWNSPDDEGGMTGWRIFVDYDGDGALDAGEPSAVTDSAGYYNITGVAAGTWDVVEVTQPGWVRTTAERRVTLGSGEAETGANFGNFKGSLVMAGDTATVGFWKNKDSGQKLIRSLNGGPSATALGNWLASNFPNMYGPGSGANNLAGRNNAQVASYFASLANNPAKELEAQVLATALAVYATDRDWAGGNYAAAYGFNVTSTGVKNDAYNVGDSGAAFGAPDGSALTVWDILQRTNDRARNGTLWFGCSSSVKTMARLVYVGINGAGGIG